MRKEEKRPAINIKIKLNEDLSSRLKAIEFATKKLREMAADYLTEGFIYIEGPTISDLIVLKAKKNKSKFNLPDIRSCTSDEWTKYFYTYVCLSKEDRERMEEERKEKSKLKTCRRLV